MFEKIREKMNNEKTQKMFLVAVVAALGATLITNMYSPYSEDAQKKNVIKYIDELSTKVAEEAKKSGDIKDKAKSCKEALLKSGISLNEKEEEIIVNFCAAKI